MKASEPMDETGRKKKTRAGERTTITTTKTAAAAAATTKTTKTTKTTRNRREEKSLPGGDGTMEYLGLREQEGVEEGRRKGRGRAEKSARDMVREEEAR